MPNIMAFLLHHSNGVERCYLSRQYMRAYVTNFMVVSCYQMAGDSSANFCTPMHVDKILCMRVYIQINNILDLDFSRSNILIEYIGKFIHDYLANDDRYNKHCCLLPTQKIAYSLSIGIFTFDRGPFQMSVSRSCIFWLWISRKWWQIGRILLLARNKMLHVGFRLAYLYLILVHSNDQSHSYPHLDYKYP